MVMEKINRAAVLVSSCNAFKDCWKPFVKSFMDCWKDCPYNVYIISNGESFDSGCPNIHILDVEKFEKRQMVKDTDKGKEIKQLINDLKDLLELYKKGVLVEKQSTSEDSDFS